MIGATPAGKEAIRKIVKWVIDKGTFTANQMKVKFELKPDTVDVMIEFLMKYNVIRTKSLNVYRAKIKSMNDLPDEVCEMIGFEKEKEEEPIELPRDQKQVVSALLRMDREWIPTSIETPPEGRVVLFRMTNTDIVAHETPTHVQYEEDAKIGFLAHKDIWKIHPPFPLYDDSPLSNMDSLNPGTVVTHWSELEDGELEDWNKRLEPVNKYDTLHIEVDDAHKKDVYFALKWATAFMLSSLGSSMPEADDPFTKEMFEYYNILADMRSSMDLEMDIGEWYRRNNA